MERTYVAEDNIELGPERPDDDEAYEAFVKEFGSPPLRILDITNGYGNAFVVWEDDEVWESKKRGRIKRNRLNEKSYVVPYDKEGLRLGMEAIKKFGGSWDEQRKEFVFTDDEKEAAKKVSEYIRATKEVDKQQSQKRSFKDIFKRKKAESNMKTVRLKKESLKRMIRLEVRKALLEQGPADDADMICTNCDGAFYSGSEKVEDADDNCPNCETDTLVPIDGKRDRAAERGPGMGEASKIVHAEIRRMMREPNGMNEFFGPFASKEKKAVKKATKGYGTGRDKLTGYAKQLANKYHDEIYNAFEALGADYEMPSDKEINNIVNHLYGKEIGKFLNTADMRKALNKFEKYKGEHATIVDAVIYWAVKEFVDSGEARSTGGSMRDTGAHTQLEDLAHTWAKAQKAGNKIDAKIGEEVYAESRGSWG